MYMVYVHVRVEGGGQYSWMYTGKISEEILCCRQYEKYENKQKNSCLFSFFVVLSSCFLLKNVGINHRRLFHSS